MRRREKGGLQSFEGAPKDSVSEGSVTVTVTTRSNIGTGLMVPQVHTSYLLADSATFGGQWKTPCVCMRTYLWMGKTTHGSSWLSLEIWRHRHSCSTLIFIIIIGPKWTTIYTKAYNSYLFIFYGAKYPYLKFTVIKFH